LAREGEGGSDRRLGIDLGPEQIEHRAPFDSDRGDRRCPELVGSSGNCAGIKQTNGCEPTREQANSLRTQCVAPRRVPLMQSWSAMIFP
jgi:hypothetical protein